MSIKTPRLTRDRCGVFYIRLVVPKALRADIGKSELRRSLRTKDCSIAKQRALTLNLALEAALTNPKISDFEHLFNSPEVTTRKAMTIDFERGFFHADTPEEGQALQSIVASYASNRANAVREQITEIMPVNKCGTSLETAKFRYFMERIKTLKKSTYNKQLGVVGAFAKMTGNIDVGLITAMTVADYKIRLLEDNRSASTVNDHLSILRGFFDFCINNKIARMENPAVGMNIAGSSNQMESYETFSDEEIGRIFNSEQYLKQLKLPDFYWCPLIAMFTGARAEEIASLDISQIKEERGIAYIDILKGKTDNAKRKVPVHDQLIVLGFLGYVQVMKDAGYVKLFPHLRDGKNGYRKNMCRNFGKYLDKKEVNVVSELKVFHSFRHTVVTALTNAGVNDGLKRVMVGHDMDTRMSSHDVYIHESELTLENMQRAINKLKYKSVNFDALRLPATTFLEPVARRLKSKFSTREAE